MVIFQRKKLLWIWKNTNFGDLYLLYKINKRLSDVPCRPVVSNCGTSTEKVSEFLDHHLKAIIQEVWFYVKGNQWRSCKEGSKYGKNYLRFYLGDSRCGRLVLLKIHLIVGRTKRYLLICSYKWQDLFSPNTTLSLCKKYSVKFLELLLAQNLYHLICAYVWDKFFLKHRNCSCVSGLDI